MKASEMMGAGLGILSLTYGRSGSGKSYCWGKLDPTKGVAILSEKNSLRTLQRANPKQWGEFEVACPTSAGDFEKAVDVAVANNGEWIVVDTVTSYYDMIWQEYLEKNELPADYVEYAIYRYCLHVFEGMLLRLLKAADMGCHVFLISHQKWLKEGDDKRSISWSAPDLPGVLPERISRRLDVVCRADYRLLGTTQQWRLSLPSGRAAGKDLLGLFDSGETIENDFRHFLPYGGVQRDHKADSTASTSAAPALPKKRAKRAKRAPKPSATEAAVAEVQEAVDKSIVHGEVPAPPEAKRPLPPEVDFSEPEVTPAGVVVARQNPEPEAAAEPSPEEHADAIEAKAEEIFHSKVKPVEPEAEKQPVNVITSEIKPRHLKILAKYTAKAANWDEVKIADQCFKQWGKADPTELTSEQFVKLLELVNEDTPF